MNKHAFTVNGTNTITEFCSDKTTHVTFVLLCRTLEIIFKMANVYQVFWTDSRWQPGYQVLKVLLCVLKAHRNCLMVKINK